MLGYKSGLREASLDPFICFSSSVGTSNSSAECVFPSSSDQVQTDAGPASMPFITGQLCLNLQFAALSGCRLDPNSLETILVGQPMK